MADGNYVIEGWEWDIIMACHDPGVIPVHGENLFIPHPLTIASATMPEGHVSRLVTSSLQDSLGIDRGKGSMLVKLKDRETSSSSQVSPLNIKNTSEDSFESSLHNYNHKNSETILEDIPSDLPMKMNKKKKKKRDIRLECPNFLAGRIPCACPELDALFETDLEAEETAKKKQKIGIRCQVPSCEEDISHLKSYHQRHRVCLRCANLPMLILKDLPHRYCQQCGIFHPLSDFDEGKRSCRWKLERHNKRRRKKPAEETEWQDDSGDTVKDLNVVELTLDSPNQSTDQQHTINNASTRLERELIFCDNNTQLDREGRVEVANENVSQLHQPVRGVRQLLPRTPSISAGLKRHAEYVSPCPTGRVSFKLYDWNPADFPRRLRDQIFKWLANMPVELESYVRSGCVILTFFIVMPRAMWDYVINGWVSHVENLLIWQGTRLLGTSQVSLQMKMKNTIIQDGRVMNADQDENLAPWLVDLYPSCLEAGHHTCLYVCGFNFSGAHIFVSFGGHYLECIDCEPITSEDLFYLQAWESIENLEIRKLMVVCPNLEIFGPAFVEVSTDNGISNFIPLLVADKYICAQINSLIPATSLARERKINASQGQCSKPEILKPQWAMDVLLDLGWTFSFIRKHMFLNKAEVQKQFVERLHSLLMFSFKHKLHVVIDRLVETGLKVGTIKNDGPQYAYNIEEDSTYPKVMLMNKAMSYLNKKAEKSSLSTAPKTKVRDSSVIKDSCNLENTVFELDLVLKSIESHISETADSQQAKNCIALEWNERVPLSASFNGSGNPINEIHKTLRPFFPASMLSYGNRVKQTLDEFYSKFRHPIIFGP